MTEEERETFISAVRAVNDLLASLGRRGIFIVVLQEEIREGEARILQLRPQLKPRPVDLF